MRTQTHGTELAQVVNPRRFAVVLGAAVAILTLLGLIEYAGAALNPFEMDRDFSLPSLLTGGLFLLAAGLALLLAGTGHRLAWIVTAAAFAAPGLDELLFAHARLEDRLDLHWVVAFLPVVIVCGLVWLAATRLLELASARRLVLGSAVVWIVAQALEGAFVNTTFAVAIVKQVLELAAVSALVVGLHEEMRHRLGASRRRATDVADEYVSGLSPWRLGAAITAIIVLVSIAGAAVGNGTVEAYFFDLNGENTLPAAFSGALLFLAAGLCFLLHDAWPPDAHGGRWWLVLGLVFAFLGLDEIGALHEKIQEATDIHPGQVVLLPLVVAAGLGWIVALRRMPSAESRNLWIAGAGLWVLSQAVDATQPPNQFVWSVVPEEALEMAGSGLFALALIVALRDRPRAVSG